MKRAYADTPEGQVHYLVDGGGDSILMLHQTPTSADEYADVVPLLAKKYRAIAMDTLGYGSSDRPPVGFTIEQYAQNVLHFLDALGVQKTHVVGNLTGATLAIELAAMHPERVDTMVLGGVSLYTPEEQIKMASNPMFDPLEITDDGAFLQKQWDFYRSVAPHFPPEKIYRIVLASLRAGVRLHDGHHASFKYDKGSKLPMIKSPTLVMSGDEDLFYSKLETVQQLIPRCKTHVLKGRAFAIGYDKPELLAEIVMDFIENSGV